MLKITYALAATLVATSLFASDAIEGLIHSRVPTTNSVGQVTLATRLTQNSTLPAVIFSGSAYTVGITITPTTTLPEGEQDIAVYPGNPNTFLAAISDFSLRNGSNTTKYCWSFNGGQTWQQNFVPLINDSPATSDGLIWPYNSDPVVTIDNNGYAYLANLYFNSSSTNNSNGLYVSVLNLNSGQTFIQNQTIPVLVNTNPSTNIVEDKEWISVDNTNTTSAGNVYVSWTHFVGNSSFIYFSRSTNHGQTWSTPILISNTSQSVQGSNVGVGPAGEIYIIFENFYVQNQRQQFLCKSVDTGLTFTAPIPISPIFNELSFSSTYRKNSFPSLAISPVNGNIYVLYSDMSNTAKVEFIKSSDGGNTFTAPLTLIDTPKGQQLMPAISVDNNGIIHTCWFDTRNGRNASTLDIYASRSLDNGQSFSPNIRVTSKSFSSGHASFIGDYTGITSWNGVASPVWNNGGFNNGQLQTTNLK